MSRIEELKREAQAMQDYLEVNVGGSTIDEYIDRIDTLGVYYARSGAMHAEIVGLIDSAMAKAMGDNMELIAQLPASLVQKYIKGVTAELNALERWIDRINASCNKQCDNLRTLISYEKQRAQIL
ncbi:MAG: hypothetical protein IKY51_03155 [Alistipes sp.]|nr:hypothetical protein [Alistipes sp.]